MMQRNLNKNQQGATKRSAKGKGPTPQTTVKRTMGTAFKRQHPNIPNVIERSYDDDNDETGEKIEVLEIEKPEKAKKTLKNKAVTKKPKPKNTMPCGTAPPYEVQRRDPQTPAVIGTWSPFPRITTACEICGNPYKTRNEVYSHKWSHDRIKFKCPHCIFDYVHRSSLARHILRDHREINSDEETSDSD